MPRPRGTARAGRRSTASTPSSSLRSEEFDLVAVDSAAADTSDVIFSPQTSQRLSFLRAVYIFATHWATPGDTAAAPDLDTAAAGR